MKDPEKVKDLILDKVDLATVMLGYGTQFSFSPLHADEVQYRCTFHGKGDMKPSARFYRNTRSCYCWVCRKSWDVIEFIKDKEVLNYFEALKFIAAKYRIDLSSIPDDPEFIDDKKAKKSVSETRMRMDAVHKALLRMRGKLELDKYKILCSYFLLVSYRRSGGEDVTDSLLKLEEKISKAGKCLS